MESFFGNYTLTFETRGELVWAIYDYIRDYNQEQIQLKLKELGPRKYWKHPLMSQPIRSRSQGHS
ncbi:IS3 family transposase [Pasteurella oralis]|uniref:IS3 family transposase n=1 Tax=Pasteurella oralis TaxID=1071947 RepID=A0ABW4NW26_9PAST